jgi:GT2 family glycosyltransferase
MPNRNNGPLLDHVLGRLAANTCYPNFELMVIDDGSTDSSREILRRWRNARRFADFRLLEREHAGAIDALNAGLAQASGELVVQLDGDASIETPGWLDRMVALFSSDPRIGVLTAKVVFDSGEIQACGVDVIGPAGFHGRGTVVTEPVGRRTYHERVARRRDGECSQCEAPAEVDGGVGVCMIYRREVALELGGYDPGYAPVWFDDLDLTLAMRRGGLKVFYLPDVRVVHHVRRKQTGGAVRKLARSALPAHVRHRIARRVDLRPREQRERLHHHYAYWRRKWGFDLLNPDMEAITERFGDTEVCWRLNAAMREAGERIVAGWDGVRV